MAREGQLVGRKIDRYRFQRLLGIGSSGEVYRAHDTRLRRDVAIKVFDPKLVKSPGVLERFMKEARIQARLEHANIVPIYDLLEHRKQLFIVMRCVNGLNMRAVIERKGRALTPKEAMTYFRQVLDAVGFAHSKGVIHQDLKPHNVQVTPAGEALVLDFGVARLVGERRDEGPKMAGTPAYISPEQVEGRYTDSRTDIYSLGMSLYQITTGHHPFESAEDLDQILRWQVERNPVPPTHFAPDLPTRFAQTIMKAISKQPRDRYRSCRELLQSLDRSLERAKKPSAQTSEDVRWDPRAEVAIPALIQVIGQEESRSARTIDLSVSGAAMQMAEPPPPGTPVRVELYLPSGGNRPTAVTAEAIVVRVSEKGVGAVVGFGVRFTAMADGEREKIGAVVRESLVLGARPTHPGRSAG